VGSIYNGQPANVTYPGPVTIVIATNTSPIVLSCAGPHSLTTGDTVDVEGVATNLNANGIWPVVVTGLSTLTLTGSVGTAVGSGGTLQNLAAGATITIPSDGDADAAATFDPPFSGLADRTAKNSLNVGGYKLVKIVTAIANADSNTLWAQQTSVPAAWTQANAPVLWTVSGANNGDIIDATLSFTGTCNSGTLALFSLLFATQVPGGAISGFAKFSTSNQGFTPGANPYPMTLRGVAPVGALGGATFSLCLGFYSIGGTAPSMSAQGDYQFSALLWRPTGMPQ
jgi:hypothetical protein